MAGLAALMVKVDLVAAVGLAPAPLAEQAVVADTQEGEGESVDIRRAMAGVPILIPQP